MEKKEIWKGLWKKCQKSAKEMRNALHVIELQNWQVVSVLCRIISQWIYFLNVKKFPRAELAEFAERNILDF